MVIVKNTVYHVGDLEVIAEKSGSIHFSINSKNTIYGNLDILIQKSNFFECIRIKNKDIRFFIDCLYIEIDFEKFIDFFGIDTLNFLLKRARIDEIKTDM